jgi:hypothetical protein
MQGSAKFRSWFWFAAAFTVALTALAVTGRAIELMTNDTSSPAAITARASAAVSVPGGFPNSDDLYLITVPQTGTATMQLLDVTVDVPDETITARNLVGMATLDSLTWVITGEPTPQFHAFNNASLSGNPEDPSGALPARLFLVERTGTLSVTLHYAADVVVGAIAALGADLPTAMAADPGLDRLLIATTTQRSSQFVPNVKNGEIYALSAADLMGATGALGTTLTATEIGDLVNNSTQLPVEGLAIDPFLDPLNANRFLTAGSASFTNDQVREVSRRTELGVEGTASFAVVGNDVFTNGNTSGTTRYDDIVVASDGNFYGVRSAKTLFNPSSVFLQRGLFQISSFPGTGTVVTPTATASVETAILQNTSFPAINPEMLGELPPFVPQSGFKPSLRGGSATCMAAPDAASAASLAPFAALVALLLGARRRRDD